MSQNRRMYYTQNHPLDSWVVTENYIISIEHPLSVCNFTLYCCCWLDKISIEKETLCFI